MDAASPKKSVPLYYYPALCVLSIVVRLLYLTLRVRVSEKSNGNMRREGASVLIFWHNKISLAPYIKRKFRKRFPIFGLVSQSKDGEILECFFRFFGIDSERGSSSKGAMHIIPLILMFGHSSAMAEIRPSASSELLPNLDSSFAVLT